MPTYGQQGERRNDKDVRTSGDLLASALDTLTVPRSPFPLVWRQEP
jgi:hypothetical protein